MAKISSIPLQVNLSIRHRYNGTITGGILSIMGNINFLNKQIGMKDISMKVILISRFSKTHLYQSD